MATQAQTEAPSEARLGHETLMAYNRAMTQWCSKGALHEDAGTLLAAGGSWIPSSATVPSGPRTR
jgi:hypothetical protein